MFACIYFSEDDSLSVVSKADKNLLFREDGWKEKEQVEMKWEGKDYNGTIIRIHGTFYLTFSMYVLHKYQASKYQQINMSLTSFSFIIFLNLCRVNPTII